MSANVSGNRISTQKDLSKIERWAAVNKIFSKDNSKGLSSDLKKPITQGLVLDQGWQITAWEPNLASHLFLYGQCAKNAFYLKKIFN